MKDLHIPASGETPEIRFEYSRHCLIMQGASFPEDAMSFHGPIGSSLHSYLDQLPVDCQVQVNIELGCSVSSSATAIRSLVGMLDQAATNGPSISVDWLHAEDDDMVLGFGIDLMEEHGSLQFNMVAPEKACHYRHHARERAGICEHSQER